MQNFKKFVRMKSQCFLKNQCCLLFEGYVYNIYDQISQMESYCKWRNAHIHIFQYNFKLVALLIKRKEQDIRVPKWYFLFVFQVGRAYFVTCLAKIVISGFVVIIKTEVCTILLVNVKLRVWFHWYVTWRLCLPSCRRSNYEVSPAATAKLIERWNKSLPDAGVRELIHQAHLAAAPQQAAAVRSIIMCPLIRLAFISIEDQTHPRIRRRRPRCLRELGVGRANSNTHPN